MSAVASGTDQVLTFFLNASSVCVFYYFLSAKCGRTSGGHCFQIWQN